MLMAAMMKVGFICMLFILLGMGSASADGAKNVSSNWDWLGTPVYSYADYNSPYRYTYYYPFFDNNPLINRHSPAFSDRFLNYVPPNYYQEPYWAFPYSSDFGLRYLAKPWWIGSHTDLPKVLNIARSGSSVRVYSNGFWQPP
jgi:hypothetical protein